MKIIRLDVEKRPGVYCIANEASGRCYVGSSKNVAARLACHLSMLRRGRHHSIKLQRAWEKHGEGAFGLFVLEYPAEGLLSREQDWIDSLHAACAVRGYNVLPNARSRAGCRATPQARAHMSASARGKPKRFRPETLEAFAARSRGRKIPPEQMARMIAARTGKTHKVSAKTRAKLREAGLRNGFRRETLEAAWAANRGRQTSPETRAKMSASHKARFVASEARAARSTAARLGWQRRREAMSCTSSN